MPSPNKVRTGGEIDAFCTRCDLTLAHTIIAMVGSRVVKVTCNTCHADHAYRGDPSRPPPARTPTGKKAPPSWDERLRGKDVGGARAYSRDVHFHEDDVLVHPTFGLGVVVADRSTRMDVAFKTFEKTLLNGAAPEAPPHVRPPTRTGFR